jgi:hypothetical protein
MQRPDWAPSEIDTDVPSAARIYDYLLGGCHNFAADRLLADQLISMVPDVPMMARANRAFLRRAVTFCLASGIRQFLDVGSGIPTLGNVHEVAQQADPDARVVYVDIDPVAVEHSRALLAGNDLATVVHEDLRDPERVLANPELRAVLDLDRPVALLLVAVLHFVPDTDDPHSLVSRFGAALPPGSHLVISHGTSESRPDDAEKGLPLYEKTRTPGTPRTHAEVRRLFDGFDLVDPGVVWAPEWRPDGPVEPSGDPWRSALYAGVGRKA